MMETARSLETSVSARLHGATTQKTTIFVNSFMKMKGIFQEPKEFTNRSYSKSQFSDLRDLKRTSSTSLPRGLHSEFVYTVAVPTEHLRFAFVFIDLKSNVFSNYSYHERALETRSPSAAAFWWLDKITSLKLSSRDVGFWHEARARFMQLCCLIERKTESCIFNCKCRFH
jgi:hypothetical protein